MTFGLPHILGIARKSILKAADCIVATTGGLEEDTIQCFASTSKEDFNLNDSGLRWKTIVRIGSF